MKKGTIAVLILTLLFTIAALPQSVGVVGDRKSNQALRELFKDLRDYAQTNMIPRLKDWKSGLDNSMSRDDLQALDKLRGEATRLKNAARTYALALKTAWEKNDVAGIRRNQAKIKDLANVRKALLADLKPLGVKYKSTLQRIGNAAKPYAQEWKDGMQRVGKRWYEAHGSDLTAAYKLLLAKGIEKLKTFAGLDGELKSKVAAAGFMLWDGNDLPDVDQLFAGETPDPGASANQTPDGYSLESNYPNPFNPTTNISFTIPEAQHVSLIVYDALGREVVKLVDSEFGAGTHTIAFDGQHLSSGLYIYRIRAGEFVQEKKMQLLK